MKQFLWMEIMFQGSQYRENGHKSFGLCLTFSTDCLLFPAVTSWSIKDRTIFTVGQKLKTSAHSTKFRLNSYSAPFNSLKEELNFKNAWLSALPRFQIALR